MFTRMLRLILLSLACILAGCSDSQRALTGLAPGEQIQALVLNDLAARMLGIATTGPDDYPMFLSGARPPYADTSPAVLGYVQSSFRSARPFSNVATHDATGVTERGTGRPGAILWIDSFSIPGDGPISIKAGYFV